MHRGLLRKRTFTLISSPGTYVVTVSEWDAPPPPRGSTYTLQISVDCPLVAPVGGVTSFSSGSGSSYGANALLASGVAVAVAIIAGGWYTRRRWLSR